MSEECIIRTGPRNIFSPGRDTDRGRAALVHTSSRTPVCNLPCGCHTHKTRYTHRPARTCRTAPAAWLVSVPPHLSLSRLSLSLSLEGAVCMCRCGARRGGAAATARPRTARRAAPGSLPGAKHTDAVLARAPTPGPRPKPRCACSRVALTHRLLPHEPRHSAPPTTNPSLPLTPTAPAPLPPPSASTHARTHREATGHPALSSRDAPPAKPPAPPTPPLPATPRLHGGGRPPKGAAAPGRLPPSCVASCVAAPAARAHATLERMKRWQWLRNSG